MVRYIFHHPLSTPAKKKKSFRLPCSGAPLGAPLDGKKKGGVEGSDKKEPLPATTHADRQPVKLEVQFGSVHFGTLISLSVHSCNVRYATYSAYGANLRNGYLEPAFAHLSLTRGTVACAIVSFCFIAGMFLRSAVFLCLA